MGARCTFEPRVLNDQAARRSECRGRNPSLGRPQESPSRSRGEGGGQRVDRSAGRLAGSPGRSGGERETCAPPFPTGP